jgi:hypothetical protein
MSAWNARVVAVVLAAASAAWAVANLHSPAVVAVAPLVAAVLAIVCVALLWKAPTVAAALNAVWLAAAFAAGFVLTAGHGSGTPGTVAGTPVAGRSATSPTSGSPSGAPAPAAARADSNDAMSVPPPELKQMKPSHGALSAPEVGFDYSEFIGPGTVDDGMEIGPQVGNAATSALDKVTSLFGDAAPAPPSREEATAQAVREEDAKLPQSEYSLAALAGTLPADPIEVYRFVRDNVDVDGYDGIMRGPLGTWMSRAGSPSDKLTLMAWLLVKKGIPFQFVRGSLSSDEQARVARAVAAPAAASGPLENPQVRAAVQRYVDSGTTFAAWASEQLRNAHVGVGTASARAVGARHYWLQIDRNGQALDLDPTLSDMSEGQHLATIDASFKPWPMLPDDEWHYVQIRVAADFNDGSSQQLLVFTAKDSNVAYVPLRVAFLPQQSTDLSKVATARSFDAMIVNGGSGAGTQALDLDAKGGVRQVRLEMRRKDTHGTIQTSTRDLLPPGVAPSAIGPSLAGLTTILIVPGSAANLFTCHMYLKSMAAVADAAAHAKDGRPKPTPLYPIRIADYFSRDDVVASELAAPAGTRWYRSRPNVALQRTWFTVASGGATPAATEFDIVDNTMAPAAGHSARSAAANLARGYADTQIEHDVQGGSGEANGTIAIFDAAKASGVAPLVLTSTGAVPQGVRPLARGIESTFASGNVAIGLVNGVTIAGRPAYGWWDIDATTGNAVGRVTGGAGRDLVPYAYILRFYSSALWLLEMAQTAHECHSGGDCLKAMCEAVVASIFAGAGWKHAAHVHSINGLIAGVGMVVIGEMIGGKVIGSMCGGQPGGEGGGGGGGSSPPLASDDAAPRACMLH